MKRSRPRESTIRGFHSLLLWHGAALLFRRLWKALIKLALTGRETRPSATNSSVGPINRFVADSLQSADQLDPRWRRDELPNGAVVLTFYLRFANSMVNNVALWTFKMPTALPLAGSFCFEFPLRLLTAVTSKTNVFVKKAVAVLRPNPYCKVCVGSIFHAVRLKPSSSGGNVNVLGLFRLTVNWQRVSS